MLPTPVEEASALPTYVCYTQSGLLSQEQRRELARRITGAHSDVTGAPPSFAQVIFRELLSGGHFIGGRSAPTDSVWIHGHIRNGRTDEAKSRLIRRTCDDVAEVVSIPRRLVWVYLSELNAAEMIEFGHVLPKHGEEQQWLDGLPSPLRDDLLAPSPAGVTFSPHPPERR